MVEFELVCSRGLEGRIFIHNLHAEFLTDIIYRVVGGGKSQVAKEGEWSHQEEEHQSNAEDATYFLL